jgi:hypothetical protein
LVSAIGYIPMIRRNDGTGQPEKVALRGREPNQEELSMVCSDNRWRVPKAMQA